MKGHFLLSFKQDRIGAGCKVTLTNSRYEQCKHTAGHDDLLVEPFKAAGYVLSKTGSDECDIRTASVGN